MTHDEQITVTLTARESRALAFSANLFGEVLAARLDEDQPCAGATGAVKLEVALMEIEATV